MHISLEIGLLVGSLLIFGSILISKTGYRFGIPTLLMFLVAGMLFGTDGLGIQFDNATQAQYIGTIALSIILFSGGMDTKLAEIRPVAVPGIMLSTVGVLLTTALTGLFIYFISGWQHTEIGFSLLGSLLLAATMSSTDSASVFNILRTQRINLRHNLRPMLELESGSNDPMAYLLTIILIQCIQSGDLSAGDIATSLVLQFAVGGAAGFLLGKAAVWLVNRINLKNEELYPVLIISFVFIIYCATFLLNLPAERQRLSGRLPGGPGHRQQPPDTQEGDEHLPQRHDMAAAGGDVPRPGSAGQSARDAGRHGDRRTGGTLYDAGGTPRQRSRAANRFSTSSSSSPSSRSWHRACPCLGRPAS